MKKRLAFLFILSSMETSLAKSIDKESSMKNMNDTSKDSPVSRSANSGNGFNPGNTGGSGFNPGNTGGSGFNPGNTGGSGFNPGISGGSGFNPGISGGSDFNPGISGGSGFNPDISGGSGFNPGISGGSGFNPGISGGSGFNPGISGGSGFNPGFSGGSGLNPGGSGYNPGNQKPNIPDFVPDESITNQGNGMSGYNPGVTGGSGFNPGNTENGWSGGSGSHPGSQRPDSRDESVIFPENGGSGYNPGATEGSGYNSGNLGGSGFNSGPRSDVRKKDKRNKTPFRTKIMFANDADTDQPKSQVSTQSQTKSSLPPYQPGGDKTPYLRGKPNKQTKPVSEENIPRIFLLQPVRQTKPFRSTAETNFQPLIQTLPFNVVSAQTLPSPIQFDQPAKQPYVAGQNKQQYLRGRQTKPHQAHSQQNDTPAYILLNPVRQTKPFPGLNTISIQTLPSPIQFDASQDKPAFSPQILVQNPGSGIFAQTLPSPIQFDHPTVKQPYIAGQNKQQYLRDRQTRPYQADQREGDNAANFLFPSPINFDGNGRFSPLLLAMSPTSGIFAQTLPSPIQFDQPAANQPYVAGQNKQQYLRGRQTNPYQADPQEKNTPAYILFNPARQTKPFPADDQEIVSAQTLPSQIQFAEDEQLQPFLNFPPASRAAAQSGSPAGFLPGVSTKPRFPPGYTPAGVTRYAQAGVTGYVQAPELSMGGYGGPKTVLYIF